MNGALSVLKIRSLNQVQVTEILLWCKLILNITKSYQFFNFSLIKFIENLRWFYFLLIDFVTKQNNVYMHATDLKFLSWNHFSCFNVLPDELGLHTPWPFFFVVTCLALNCRMIAETNTRRKLYLWSLSSKRLLKSCSTQLWSFSEVVSSNHHRFFIGFNWLPAS